MLERIVDFLVEVLAQFGIIDKVLSYDADISADFLFKALVDLAINMSVNVLVEFLLIDNVVDN
ncbi:MAG: hypothetical protein RMZ69_34270 [Nostoc sp. ChiQUE01a]|nr:hypothetical protein [Nostoc sp. ChiQUE01a]